MTECQIVGGPLDGQVLATAGNPEQGEKVAHAGSFYRLYERPGRAWVAVWGGYLDFDPDYRLVLADLAADVADADKRESETWATRVAFVVFCAGLGTGAAVLALLFAALGWLVELTAGFLGGFMDLALWTSALGGLVGLGALIYKPDLLERLLET